MSDAEDQKNPNVKEVVKEQPSVNAEAVQVARDQEVKAANKLLEAEGPTAEDLKDKKKLDEWLGTDNEGLTAEQLKYAADRMPVMSRRLARGSELVEFGKLHEQFVEEDAYANRFAYAEGSNQHTDGVLDIYVKDKEGNLVVKRVDIFELFEKYFSAHPKDKDFYLGKNSVVSKDGYFKKKMELVEKLLGEIGLSPTELYFPEIYELAKLTTEKSEKEVANMVDTLEEWLEKEGPHHRMFTEQDVEDFLEGSAFAHNKERAQELLPKIRPGYALLLNVSHVILNDGGTYHVVSVDEGCIKELWKKTSSVGGVDRPIKLIENYRRVIKIKLLEMGHDLMDFGHIDNSSVYSACYDVLGYVENK
jgi:hypothetical protein